VTTGDRTDLWVPLAAHEQLTGGESLLARRTHWWLQLIGRLQPGADLAAAQASMNVTLQRFLAEDSFRLSEVPDADPTVPRTASPDRLTPVDRQLELRMPGAVRPDDSAAWSVVLPSVMLAAS
jgi:hypothetical protein